MGNRPPRPTLSKEIVEGSTTISSCSLNIEGLPEDKKRGSCPSAAPKGQRSSTVTSSPPSGRLRA